MSVQPFDQLDKSTKDQLACVFATLLLHDEGQEVSEENINNVLTKSGNTIEPYWPGLFLKALDGKNVSEFLTVSGGGAGTGAGAGANADVAEEKEEEKKEESEEEADVSMGGLFSDDDSD